MLMTKISILIILLIFFFSHTSPLVPPKFQWKVIDFAWERNVREAAIASEAYIPKNNLPSSIAKWKNKLFITIPRWKKGVPASLNYINVSGNQSQPLNPYPSWREAFVSAKASCISANSTVVSAFRIHVDQCDRLWVVDNGVSDMLEDIRQVTPPAILIFDLNRDLLLLRRVIDEEVLRDSSVLNSIVVDIVGTDCVHSYAYISDMGSNALLVYGLLENAVWRVESHYFHFDPLSGVYNVGGVDFYWSDGVSSIVLVNVEKNGYYDLYFHPTSSTKQFRMSTKLLRNKNVPKEDIFAEVEVVGDRGKLSQATAADYDPKNNVIFYTQLNKNGVSCWNLDQPLSEQTAPTIVSDCSMLEFPSDVQVDRDGNLWVLSNRQSRFLYEALDHGQVNFRVLTAPTTKLVEGTACGRMSMMDKAMSFVRQATAK